MCQQIGNRFGKSSGGVAQALGRPATHRAAGLMMGIEMDWDRFNDQFREDEDERNERLRAVRLAARCPECGRGNPKTGTPHAPTCSRATPPAA